MTAQKRKLETDKGSENRKNTKKKKEDKKVKTKKKLCPACKRFYDALNMSPASKNELKMECRHYKDIPSPPDTPDSFWELEIHTPDSWK